MLILDRSDFRGLYAITFPKVNDADIVVEEVLEVIERRYLVKLLGSELFAELQSDPNDSKFADLFKPLQENNYYSDGLKEVLKVFVYIDYQRKNHVMSTENGRVVKDSSTGTYTSAYVRDILSYNLAVDGWKAIQRYCRKNKDLRNKFRGDDLHYIFY